MTQAPPWYSKDPKSGDWASGVGVSLGKAMASDLGVKFEPVEVTWGTAIAALQGNKIDMMSMMDATPERAEAVDFPKTPLLFYSLAVLARDDLPARTWAELDQPSVRIAVPQASSMDKFLTEHVAKAAIQRFPGNAEAIAAFQAGRADAVCLFHPPLLAARQKLGAGKIVVPSPAQSQASSVAVRKEADKSFVNWVDKEIAGYYSSGPDAEVVRAVPGRLRPRSEGVTAGDEGNAQVVARRCTSGASPRSGRTPICWPSACSTR